MCGKRFGEPKHVFSLPLSPNMAIFSFLLPSTPLHPHTLGARAGRSARARWCRRHTLNTNTEQQQKNLQVQKNGGRLVAQTPCAEEKRSKFTRQSPLGGPRLCCWYSLVMRCAGGRGSSSLSSLSSMVVQGHPGWMYIVEGSLWCVSCAGKEMWSEARLLAHPAHYPRHLLLGCEQGGSRVFIDKVMYRALHGAPQPHGWGSCRWWR